MFFFPCDVQMSDDIQQKFLIFSSELVQLFQPCSLFFACFFPFILKIDTRVREDERQENLIKNIEFQCNLIKFRTMHSTYTWRKSVEMWKSDRM